jgi:hypothetical protein
MPVSKNRKKQGRPTRPSTSKKEDYVESPTWYVVLMSTLLTGGAISIILRYILSLQNLYLLGGIVAIGAGFAMMTNWH